MVYYNIVDVHKSYEGSETVKRNNTASEDMILDVENFKKQGISDFICSTFTSKKRYAPVMKHTAQGISSYANAMYRKYGDDVTVEVGYFDNDLNYHKYVTYHA